MSSGALEFLLLDSVLYYAACRHIVAGVGALELDRLADRGLLRASGVVLPVNAVDNLLADEHACGSCGPPPVALSRGMSAARSASSRASVCSSAVSCVA
jgi:hypothetical protein